MGRPNSDEWNIQERRKGSLPISLNNLIICCGLKTEQNYFDSVAKIIKQNYPQQTGINFDIESDPVDPQKMVKHLSSRKNLSSYQHVWIVFDKDDFGKDNFDNAVKSVEERNKKKSSTKYHALWSNECIELWFLLHFEYMNADIKRTRYFEKLSSHLGNHYEKNDKEIAIKMTLMGGDFKIAIKNANKLLTLHDGKTPSNCKPATNVVEFFEVYKTYLQKL